MRWQKFFKDKKVILMGLGILGRGVGDAIFLAKHASHLHVTDLKNEKELSSSLERLKEFKNISYTLGEHRLKDFRDVDMVVKSAGVPLDSIYVAEARKTGVPVYMSAALFTKFFMEEARGGSGVLIGVTGTKGKSTVSHLISHILEAYFMGNRKVLLGGNAYTGSTLAFLEDMKSDDLVVLELDSWQLQGFGDLKISPHIAVFTSFFPDHMNYYKEDMERYFEDKANIFKYQDEDRFLVSDDSSLAWIKENYPEQSVYKLSPQAESEVRSWKMPLPGEHNAVNVILAVTAAEFFGLEMSQLRPLVEKFKGVPGRLEFIREVGGVKFYNDTTASNPTSALFSLKAISKDKNIIFIMGGSDKGLDVSDLEKEVWRYAKNVVLLPGTGTEKLSLGEEDRTVKAQGMKEAVEMAYNKAEPGDAVLLSPAFASFGIFKNEFDRGEQFVMAVNKLN